jgi:hypothetical protein
MAGNTYVRPLKRRQLVVAEELKLFCMGWRQVWLKGHASTDADARVLQPSSNRSGGAGARGYKS